SARVSKRPAISKAKTWRSSRAGRKVSSSAYPRSRLNCCNAARQYCHNRRRLDACGQSRQLDSSTRLFEPGRSGQVRLGGELQSAGRQCNRNELVDRPPGGQAAGVHEAASTSWRVNILSHESKGPDGGVSLERYASGGTRE